MKLSNLNAKINMLLNPKHLIWNTLQIKTTIKGVNQTKNRLSKLKEILNYFS